jgi:hypothetical protein
VLLSYAPQVVLKHLEQSVPQHGYTILLALGLADGDFATAEVEVLDTQPEGFEESQAGTVQERAYQARGALQFGQDCLDLVAGQHDRQSLRLAGPDDSFDAVQRLFQHLLVEEQSAASA